MKRLTDEEWREVCNLLASPTTGAAAPGLRKLIENYQAELEACSYRQLEGRSPES